MSPYWPTTKTQSLFNFSVSVWLPAHQRRCTTIFRSSGHSSKGNTANDLSAKSRNYNSTRIGLTGFMSRLLFLDKSKRFSYLRGEGGGSNVGVGQSYGRWWWASVSVEKKLLLPISQFQFKDALRLLKTNSRQTRITLVNCHSFDQMVVSTLTGWHTGRLRRRKSVFVRNHCFLSNGPIKYVNRIFLISWFSSSHVIAGWQEVCSYSRNPKKKETKN